MVVGPHRVSRLAGKTNISWVELEKAAVVVESAADTTAAAGEADAAVGVVAGLLGGIVVTAAASVGVGVGVAVAAACPRCSLTNVHVAVVMGASAGTAQLPSIVGMGAENAAGVLGYCVKNRLVDATSANAMLDKLNKKPGVKGSGAFKSGESGIIHAGKKDISLDSLKGDAKGKHGGKPTK